MNKEITSLQGTIEGAEARLKSGQLLTPGPFSAHQWLLDLSRSSHLGLFASMMGIVELAYRILRLGIKCAELLVQCNF